MPAKKKPKTKEKLYTYEEYRKAFGVNSQENEIRNDANAFGLKLAKAALTKVTVSAKSR